MKVIPQNHPSIGPHAQFANDGDLLWADIGNGYSGVATVTCAAGHSVRVRFKNGKEVWRDVRDCRLYIAQQLAVTA